MGVKRLKPCGTMVWIHFYITSQHSFESSSVPYPLAPGCDFKIPFPLILLSLHRAGSVRPPRELASQTATTRSSSYSYINNSAEATTPLLLASRKLLL